MGTTDSAQEILARLDLINPCWELGEDKFKRARRLDTLAGKRVGILDNRKDNADVILKRVAARLEQDFKSSTVMYRSKPVYSRRAEVELLDELAANCDLVITATGA